MRFARVKGVFFRYLYTALKGPQQLSDLFYWPLVDILLWGLTSVWIQTQHTAPNLPLILMTGLIFWQITWRGSADIAVSLLHEFWHRNLINLFSTPLKISEWIFGVLLLCLCKLVITVAFGSLVVYLLYSLNVFTVGWEFIPFAVSLLLFGWTLSFISSSAIIYWGHQVEMFAWMMGFLFAPFSAVFYPIEILPAWAQTISWCLPTTYIFEGMRSILSTGSFPWHYFWVSLLLNGLYLSLSIVLFKYMFEKSRAKGLARLE
ncbi:MAG: ABC transporter permease [Verrucomicrobiota bacterium]|nr:ABC transporter permease [Verrucomicrobiota bacterium]